ncbi:MAG: hypothetical protein K9N36_08935, partial [Candidatus Marinimicrobia bacterium]|nr:hypothetical protein [Candidatus Neomarinimicrobiota bacterium]
DQNCDQSEIDQEREQYDDYIFDIFSCINNFGEGYDSRHVESELGGDAYSDPERVCLHSTIENRLGRDVLCAWWQNNPAWQLIGSSGVPVWGDYEAYCGDAGGVEMTPEIRNELNEIVICCKSEADIGQLIDIRNRIARMLDCIPEDEPSFNCLNIKPQLGSLRDYYQLELDRANNAIQATQNHINQYCP